MVGSIKVDVQTAVAKYAYICSPLLPRQNYAPLVEASVPAAVGRGLGLAVATPTSDVGRGLGLAVPTPTSDVGRGLGLAVPTPTSVALAIGEGVGATAVSPVPRIGKRWLGLSLHYASSKRCRIIRLVNPFLGVL